MRKRLDAARCRQLAMLLPDEPQTVISRAHLLWGTARAYALGLTESRFETAVVEDPGCPGEPMVFSQNPQQAADLMPLIPNWFCLNCSLELAEKLAPLLAVRMGCPVRQMADIYHTLTQPPPSKFLNSRAVRLLTPEDLPLLLAAPPELRGPDPARLLRQTAAAGAIIDGQLVAVAQNYALSQKFGDIGVFTLPGWRGRGLAAATAANVAAWLQQNGRTPVWSCGASNLASLRVAEKLGFVEYGRRLYLILPS